MSTTAIQKALLISAEGETYTVGHNTIPAPGPKEVLVNIRAAALNPADWKILGVLSRYNLGYPFFFGLDGAGVVEDVGAESTSLVKGDRILFQGWYDKSKATFQEYCIVPEALTAKIPSNLTFEEAASVPIGLLTAILPMFVADPSAHSLRLPPFWDPAGKAAFSGKPALIMGGASSVGQYVIQVAKLAGFSPIITTASPRNAPLLVSLGATHVLDRGLASSGLHAAITTALDGTPLLFAYDASAYPDTQLIAYNALGPGGKMIVVHPHIDEIPADVKEQGEQQGKILARAQGSIYMQSYNNRCAEAVFARLEGWLADGSIKPNHVDILPNGLAGIREGLERIQANKVSAVKLIVRPHETP